MFEKVSLATDGSPESAHAARMAVELTNRLGSELLASASQKILLGTAGLSSAQRAQDQ